MFRMPNLIWGWWIHRKILVILSRDKARILTVSKAPTHMLGAFFFVRGTDNACAAQVLPS